LHSRFYRHNKYPAFMSKVHRPNGTCQKNQATTE